MEEIVDVKLFVSKEVQYRLIQQDINKKLAASKAYSIPTAKCISKHCKFVKNYFFSFKLLHAHLQYVCNIPTKH